MNRLATKPPVPESDWISRSEVARILGISLQTAFAWDRQGKLKQFEHGAIASRYRRFSRTLVTRHLELSWRKALELQDSPGGSTGSV